MKYKILFTLIFISIVTLTKAQDGQLDPSFGINGFIKADLGSHFNYNGSGIKVLAKPDGTLYSIFADNGTVVIGKMHNDGSLDSSYGNKGLSVPVITNFFTAALQPDGKIIVVGNKYEDTYDGYAEDLQIERFNGNGTLDNTFNGNGKIVYQQNKEGLEPDVLKIQDDGKILVGYHSHEEGTFYLQRYNNNGSTDSSFNNTGRVLSSYDSSPFSSISIQDDGKIILAGAGWDGNSAHIFDVKRLNYNGTPDSTFNGTGETRIDIGFQVGLTFSSSIQSDGKLIIAGYADSTGQKDFLLARYNTNGTLDTATFGVRGIQITAFAGRNSVATSIAIQNDGKILLGGYSGITDNDFAQARYTTNGIPDSTYNGTGTEITDFDSGNDLSAGIVIEEDGQVLVLGTTKKGDSAQILAVSRYNTNGSIDPSFDGNGKLTVRLPVIYLQGNTHFSSGALQSDGKVVVAGYSWNGNNFDFAVARYSPNGIPDSSFFSNGQQFTDFNSSPDTAYAVAIQNNGDIVVAGASGNFLALAWFDKNGSLVRKETSNTFPRAASIAIQSDEKIVVNCQSVLLRYNTNGLLDSTFGINGAFSATLDMGYPFSCDAFALQSDGKIVVAGPVYRYGYGPGPTFILSRLNSNGSFDSTFGTNGSSIFFESETPPFGNEGTAVAVQDDGKIIVAGTTQLAYHAFNQEIATMRFNADGSFDTFFERYLPPLPPTSPYNTVFPQNFGTSVSLQPDHKVITGGYSYDGSAFNFTLLRYNADGSLDHTFNNTGASIIPLSSANNKLIALAASTGNNGVTATSLSNGNLYAVGFGQYPGNLGIIAKYQVTAGTLPVTFTNFTAELKNKSVLLQWQTLSEHNLSRFIIERSADGNAFSTIGNVAAAGNSNLKINYTTLDQQPMQGINFYRLQIVDADGKFIYSKIVSVNINRLFALKILPNPASKILYVQASGENEKASFRIFDLTGRKLKEGQVILNGNTSFSISISGLSKGIYNLELQTKAKTETKSFIKE